MNLFENLLKSALFTTYESNILNDVWKSSSIAMLSALFGANFLELTYIVNILLRLIFNVQFEMLDFHLLTFFVLPSLFGGVIYFRLAKQNDWYKAEIKKESKVITKSLFVVYLIASLVLNFVLIVVMGIFWGN